MHPNMSESTRKRNINVCYEYELPYVYIHIRIDVYISEMKLQSKLWLARSKHVSPSASLRFKGFRRVYSWHEPPRWQQCDKSAFTSEGWCRDFIINESTNQSFTGWMSSWSVWWEFCVAKTVDRNDFILNACGISNISLGDKICIDMYFVVSTVKLLSFTMSSPWVFAKCVQVTYTHECTLLIMSFSPRTAWHHSWASYFEWFLYPLMFIPCTWRTHGLSGMVVDFVVGGYCRQRNED